MKAFMVGAVLAGAVALTACEGPSVPSLIVGEPVCKDFKQAGDTVKGALRHPIRLRIMLDEKVRVRARDEARRHLDPRDQDGASGRSALLVSGRRALAVARPGLL
jgi:hypothetical protein